MGRAAPLCQGYLRTCQAGLRGKKPLTSSCPAQQPMQRGRKIIDVSKVGQSPKEVGLGDTQE